MNYAQPGEVDGESPSAASTPSPAAEGPPPSTSTKRPRWFIPAAALLVTDAAIFLYRFQWGVDTMAVQGILLAIGGSFFIVDPPFLAARAMRGGEPDAPGRFRRDRRVWGVGMFVLGAALFGAAAGIWAVFGGQGE